MAGEQADPDGDGLRNLVEYAFGLDPHVASRSGLPQAVVMNVAGQLHLAVQFQQRSLPHGLIYATSVSGNLVDWQAGGSYVGGLPPTSGLPHTVDASDVNWTRVRLVQPMSALPLRLLGVNVRRE